ncbi:type IV toxin-antitoxin system AbiEi family antitoxin [Microbacterium telephonicum]|nr:type IV toxin-antitoxin system AbiEi family antitoxin [Microbacterium telephonicum]
MTTPATDPRALRASPIALFRADEISHPDRRERAGELQRVTRGVYVPADAWQRLAPWDRYLARVHAVARNRPDAVFALESAAALHGLPVFGEPADVHVVVASPEKSRAVAGVRVHTSAQIPSEDHRGGIRVVSPEAAAVAIACARHPAVGLAVASALLRTDRSLGPDDLHALARDRATARGIRTAQWVFDRATAQTESPLEDVSLAVIEWLGFEAPELQCWFRSPGGHDRVDFLWRRSAVAGEADGEVKYSGEYGDARASLRERNARDARLRTTHGLKAVAHWAWADVVASDQLAAILCTAGLAQMRPSQPAPLLALRAALYPQTPSSVVARRRR